MVVARRDIERLALYHILLRGEDRNERLFTIREMSGGRLHTQYNTLKVFRHLEFNSRNSAPHRCNGIAVFRYGYKSLIAYRKKFAHRMHRQDAVSGVHHGRKQPHLVAATQEPWSIA